MSVRNRVLVATLLVSSGIGWLWQSNVNAIETPEQPPEAHSQSEFMRQKLKTVRTIVEGLATDNFSMIRDGAKDMKRIRESAQWDASTDPFYALYSRSFETTISELDDAAKDKNIEKATFAYVHLTMSCTACHQRIRNVKRVANPVSRRGGTVLR